MSIARLCVCLRQEGDDGIEARSDSPEGGGEEGGPSAAVTPQRRGDCCLKKRLGKHRQWATETGKEKAVNWIHAVLSLNQVTFNYKYEHFTDIVYSVV